jgi:hypothetical protein
LHQDITIVEIERPRAWVPGKFTRPSTEQTQEPQIRTVVDGGEGLTTSLDLDVMTTTSIYLQEMTAFVF